MRLYSFERVKLRSAVERSHKDTQKTANKKTLATASYDYSCLSMTVILLIKSDISQKFNSTIAICRVLSKGVKSLNLLPEILQQLHFLLFATKNDLCIFLFDYLKKKNWSNNDPTFSVSRERPPRDGVKTVVTFERFGLGVFFRSCNSGQ